MKQYKGYYIDGVVFHNKQEIEKFLEKQAVDAYRTACKIFNSHMTMEASINASRHAEKLVKQFGYTWEQVEEIEFSTYA